MVSAYALDPSVELGADRVFNNGLLNEKLLRAVIGAALFIVGGGWIAKVAHHD